MKREPLTSQVAIVNRALRASVAVVLPLSLGACSWFTDFKEQPAIEPWESPSQNAADSLTPPRGQPRYSVPVQGTAVAGYQISYTALPVVVDSFSPIPNPTPTSEASLANGKLNYQINCSVCHGLAGDGKGGLSKVNPGYAFSPSLLTDQAKNHKDGYFYGIMRNGRGLMPSYNRIEERDRWDVVNYIRTLQAGTADTTLAGYPGQNGTTVPGPSQTAPTRPAPFLKPTQTPTPGSPNINSATFKGNNENDTMRKLHVGPPAAPGTAKEKH
ncbi:MAG: cytochrome c [Gemmatimonadaceae bacterium]|nr:cytochrome c [Gemmatimonadaceae bacterium]